MMHDKYVLRTDFCEDDHLRGAFNALSVEVFGLDFEPWYRRGLWTGHYQPFTLFDGDMAVSNVSANLIDLVLDGERIKAVQFGTVMTRESHRNQGLARFLLQHAIDALRDRCDLFYLMGDKDAAGFYRKFGFQGVEESTFTLRLAAGSVSGHDTTGMGRYLDPARDEDLQVILDAAALREPVSQKAGLLGSGYLLGFYAMNGFESRFYWVRRTADGQLMPVKNSGVRFSEEDWLVVFHEEDGVLYLHDLLMKQDLPLREILSVLPYEEISSVSFGFTPDRLGMDACDGFLEVAPRVNEDTFFVLSNKGFATPPFLYPPIGLA